MKYFFTILLLTLPVALFSQLKISFIEFGLYQNKEFILKEFNAYNFDVSIEDSIIKLGENTKLKRIGKIFQYTTSNYCRNTEIAIDDTGRRCLITYVIDQNKSNNSLIVYYPFFITIYHIRLFVT